MCQNVSKSKRNLKAQNIYIKPLLNLWNIYKKRLKTAWQGENCWSKNSAQVAQVEKCHPIQGILNGEVSLVALTSCLTGLDWAVWQLTIFVFICKAD